MYPSPVSGSVPIGQLNPQASPASYGSPFGTAIQNIGSSSLQTQLLPGTKVAELDQFNNVTAKRYMLTAAAPVMLIGGKKSQKSHQQKHQNKSQKTKQQKGGKKSNKSQQQKGGKKSNKSQQQKRK